MCASPSQNSPQKPRLSQSPTTQEPNVENGCQVQEDPSEISIRSPAKTALPARGAWPGDTLELQGWLRTDRCSAWLPFCLQRPLFPVPSAARRCPPSARLLPPFQSSISGTGMQLALAPPQLLPFVSVILCFDSPRSERPSSIPPRPAGLFDGLRAPTL